MASARSVRVLAAVATLAVVLLSIPAAALSNTSTTTMEGRSGLSQTDIYLLVIVLIVLGALSYLRPKPKIPEEEETK